MTDERSRQSRGAEDGKRGGRRLVLKQDSKMARAENVHLGVVMWMACNGSRNREMVVMLVIVVVVVMVVIVILKLVEEQINTR